MTDEICHIHISPAIEPDTIPGTSCRKGQVGLTIPIAVHVSNRAVHTEIDDKKAVVKYPWPLNVVREQIRCRQAPG